MESFNISIGKSDGSITAPAQTGPARGPLPASSKPTVRTILESINIVFLLLTLQFLSVYTAVLLDLFFSDALKLFESAYPSTAKSSATLPFLPEILNELYLDGYSEEYLFPGYNGVSKHVINEVKLKNLLKDSEP